MKIVKILNNNSAVVRDDNQEKVVLGKGIAYRKKPGDIISSSLPAKVFHFSNETQSLQFQDLLINLPMNQIVAAERIVREVKTTLKKGISNVLYISLADHIHFSIINHAKGIQLKNNLLFDIMRFYPIEYALGKRGIEIIEEENGVLLPEDEAGFIALHILNAEEEDGLGTKNMIRATEMISEITDAVFAFYGGAIDDTSLAWHRFVYHLRYFTLRIIKGAVFGEDTKDRELLDLLAKKYSTAYLCANCIKELIKNKYSLDIGDEEFLHLTIHIESIKHKEK